jgi:hypothetical protein
MPSLSNTIADEINRYYVSWYYTYNIHISSTTIGTTRITKYTTVSIYATAATAADVLFTALSATISLPTPAEATAIPTLPAPTATGGVGGFIAGVGGGPTGSGTSGSEKVVTWYHGLSTAMAVAVMIGLVPLLLAISL